MLCPSTQEKPCREKYGVQPFLNMRGLDTPPRPMRLWMGLLERGRGRIVLRAWCSMCRVNGLLLSISSVQYTVVTITTLWIRVLKRLKTKQTPHYPNLQQSSTTSLAKTFASSQNEKNVVLHPPQAGKSRKVQGVHSNQMETNKFPKNKSIFPRWVVSLSRVFPIHSVHITSALCTHTWHSSQVHWFKLKSSSLLLHNWHFTHIRTAPAGVGLATMRELSNLVRT